MEAAFEILISTLRVAYGAMNNSSRRKWDMTMKNFIFSKELKMVAKISVVLFGVRVVYRQKEYSVHSPT